MADVSPREAGEETVVVENEPHSSDSDNTGDSGLKEVKKEDTDDAVSADLERTSEEQESTSRSEHDNTACSSTDEHSKPIHKEDVVESSSENNLSNKESNLVEQEKNETSEGIPNAENENKEDDAPVVQDIRPNAEENELSVDDDTQVGQTEGTSTLTEPDKIQSLYHIKWTKWKGLNTPIITQNENGPCPLIAIMNALILQRKISIPPMQEIISANQLMEYLGDCIFIQAPERLPEGAQLNYEQNMHDAFGIMSKLQTGLDVNVKFTGVTDFEFTPECVVFDLLNIKLMHGWLVDPQNVEAVKAINSLSYNQLVEKIIASKQDGADTELVSEGIVAETFLDHTATQLTYHGLCELNAKVDDEELCVFFRNNHFNTLYKHKNELFLLVTDQGFLTEDNVMWETLSNVEGDGYFVDSNFKTLPTSQPVEGPAPNTAQPPPPTASITQEDQDYLVALTLQEEQSRADTTESSTPSAQQPPHPGMTTQEWSDMQLALQLQEEEQRQHQQQQQQQQARPVGNVPRGVVATTADRPQPPNVNVAPQPQGTAQQNSNEKCTIL